MGQNQFKLKRQYWDDNGAHGKRSQNHQTD